MNENLEDYVRKAEERIEEASYLIEGKMFEASVNRSYYSALTLVIGLLEEVEIIAKTHKGMSMKFHELFIKNGKVSIDAGKILDDLSSLRQDADYEFFIEISEDQAKEALNSARSFIAEIKRYISER